MSMKNEVVGGDEARKKSSIWTRFWAEKKIGFNKSNILIFKYIILPSVILLLSMIKW